MKKRFALLAAFLAAGTISAPAFAANHYVSGAVGINWVNDVPNMPAAIQPNTALMNNGLALTGAMGCEYNSYRLEGEVGYMEGSIDKVAGVNYDGNVSVYSLMANGYYDINAGGVKPFVMGGLGLAQVGFNNVKPSATTATYSEHDTTMAYQFGVGLAVPIGKGLNVDCKYRYFGTTNFTTAFAPGNSSHVSSNGLLVGLRMNF
jgi:opacity protein-like surface antigen